MNPVPIVSGRKLVLLRLVAVSALIFIANKAFVIANTGYIQADSSRIKFSLGGEHLWAGYLFLLTSASIFVLLLLLNYAHDKKFKIAAKLIGFSWFACLLLATLLSHAT